MVKVVYFDYHGVLDRRSFRGLLETIRRTATGDVEAVAKQLTIDGDAYAASRIEPREWWQRVEQLAGPKALQAGKKYILHVDPIRQMWELLNQLHTRCPLGLFSDCPSDKKDIIVHAYNLPEFFEYLIFSCDVRLSKGDESFFRLMNQNGLYQPNEILVVDDSERNVAMAQSLGYAAHQFTDPSAAILFFKQL